MLYRGLNTARLHNTIIINTSYRTISILFLISHTIADSQPIDYRYHNKYNSQSANSHTQYGIAIGITNNAAINNIAEAISHWLHGQSIIIHTHWPLASSNTLIKTMASCHWATAIAIVLHNSQPMADNSHAEMMLLSGWPVIDCHEMPKSNDTIGH